MPLFRQHRGTLEDSLSTTVLIRNINDLMKHIAAVGLVPFKKPFRLTIKPYPEEGRNFDKRCGWFTHIVKLDDCDGGVIGFLSEAIDR